MWGLGFGVTGRISNCMAYPLFQRGSAGNLPPLPASGGGHGWNRPQPHSFSGARCPTNPPWGVENRLVQRGSVMSAAGLWPAGRCRLTSDFALFLFACGNHVSGGIREWLALPTCAIHRMPPGSSLILAPEVSSNDCIVCPCGLI
jgi:hypothetical protein